MTAYIPAAAMAALLVWLALTKPREPIDVQRHAARQAHLDTYTPQSQDREADAWWQRHGGL
jgi:hypothetical protein